MAPGTFPGQRRAHIADSPIRNDFVLLNHMNGGRHRHHWLQIALDASPKVAKVEPTSINLRASMWQQQSNIQVENGCHQSFGSSFSVTLWIFQWL
jgi:hypothetical protein